jgi:hypothetical protein
VHSRFPRDAHRSQKTPNGRPRKSVFHFVGIARGHEEYPGDACTKKAFSAKEKKVDFSKLVIERDFRLAQDSKIVLFAVQRGRR